MLLEMNMKCKIVYWNEWIPWIKGGFTLQCIPCFNWAIAEEKEENENQLSVNQRHFWRNIDTFHIWWLKFFHHTLLSDNNVLRQARMMCLLNGWLRVNEKYIPLKMILIKRLSTYKCMRSILLYFHSRIK